VSDIYEIISTTITKNQMIDMIKEIQRDIELHVSRFPEDEHSRRKWITLNYCIELIYKNFEQ